jgi:hypothetical protein
MWNNYFSQLLNVLIVSETRLVEVHTAVIEYVMRHGPRRKLLNSCVANYNFAYVLCGCETWSSALREEYGLKVFGNRVLRKYSDTSGIK